MYDCGSLRFKNISVTTIKQLVYKTLPIKLTYSRFDMVDLGQIYLCSSLTTRGLLFNDPTLRHTRDLGVRQTTWLKLYSFFILEFFQLYVNGLMYVNVGKENSIFIKFVGGSLEDLSVLIHI